ncbi:MAG: HAMP domain-containing histidine kinase, partial [Myxococcales bacterium]|nr:HAMP domain-containing histidine kinase [Myxococcales bacterium]
SRRGATNIAKLVQDDLRNAQWTPVDRDLLDAEVRVAVRMPWAEGPCAVILVEGSTTPGFLGAFLPASEVWLAPLVAVLLTVLIALVPVVRRLERLIAAVEASAAGGFVAPPEVAGHDEVAALSRAFTAASAEVGRQLAARDDRERALREFLSNTTHDVMLPLTVLMQHLAVARAGLEDDAPLRAPVVGAIDEAHYIAALIQNLSAVARLDVVEPRLELGPVDLNAVVDRVVARHRAMAVERGVELVSGVPEAPVLVDADLTFIEQAVSNVVYNAIHYNRVDGHVAVVLDRTSPGFLLRVLDDGPGIPGAELHRLVERGFRGNAARGRGTSGHGLGLHITHTVAKLHGFGLEFENRPEGGLQVSLHGPAAV